MTRFGSAGLRPSADPAAGSVGVITLFSLAAVGVVIAEFDDAGFRDGGARKLSREAPFAHDEDPVGKNGEFLDVRGDHDDSHAGAGERADGGMDLFPGADIHAA